MCARVCAGCVRRYCALMTCGASAFRAGNIPKTITMSRFSSEKPLFIWSASFLWCSARVFRPNLAPLYTIVLGVLLCMHGAYMILCYVVLRRCEPFIVEPELQPSLLFYVFAGIHSHGDVFDRFFTAFELN